MLIHWISYDAWVKFISKFYVNCKRLFGEPKKRILNRLTVTMNWKTCPSMLIKLVIIFAVTRVVAGSNRFTIPVVTAPVDYFRLRGKSKYNYHSTVSRVVKVIDNYHLGEKIAQEVRWQNKWVC